MTPSEAREAISDACQTGVAAMSGSPTLILDGERGKPSAGSAWIRVSVRPLPSPPMTLGVAGERYAERRGVVIGQCFAPHGTDDGAAAAEEMAQDFRDLFEGTDLAAAGATEPAGINFETADLRYVGVTEGWIQVNAEIPFTFGELV